VAAVSFFDLDKTIIAGSSALAFSRPFFRHGLITRRTIVRSGYAQLSLLASGADAGTMDTLRRRITSLCAGWDVCRVQEIVAASLAATVEPLLYREAVALIGARRAAGDTIAVLSASGADVVGPIAALVGADLWRATLMDVADGRYTGEIGYYCYGEVKAQAAAVIAAERGVPLADCHAYTDSITDLPLLEAVGHPTAVNPDRALRRVAGERGWPVLDFATPARPGAGRRRTLAAGLGAAAVGGAACALLRSPRSGTRSAR
jgi:HAD superfamily hydrolase (TIGR01490 family)